MHSIKLRVAAIGSLLLLTGAAARAELIYGFEASDFDGFSANNEVNVTQSTVGATQGKYSLDTTVTANSGQQNGGATTGEVPLDFTTATSATYDLTTTGDLNYLFIVADFDYTGANGVEHFVQDAGTGVQGSDPNQDSRNFGGNQTAYPATLNLAVFKDPDAAGDGKTGHNYTVSQIMAFDAAYENTTETVDGFQFHIQNGGSYDATPPATAEIYIDNVQVTPEPTSCLLLGIAMSPLLIGRRRRLTE